MIKGGPDSVKRLGLSLKELGEDLLDTFVYLEQNNVFHSDIAPKNIIYDQANERCRIVDFGSAISKEEAYKNRSEHHYIGRLKWCRENRGMKPRIGTLYHHNTLRIGHRQIAVQNE